MMKAGREMDMVIATKVMGHSLHKQKQVILEATSNGSRPLRSYSKSIEDAWEVAEAMGITLIPIEGGSWFALVGPKDKWKSPADFLTCLQNGDFLRAGAAVTESAPLSICLAALKASEKRNVAEDTLAADEQSEVSLREKDQHSGHILN